MLIGCPININPISVHLILTIRIRRNPVFVKTIQYCFKMSALLTFEALVGLDALDVHMCYVQLPIG